MALYKAQLREMEARVSSRPYLFERVMQVRVPPRTPGCSRALGGAWDLGGYSWGGWELTAPALQAGARRAIEHRFSQVLEALGIEEAGLWRQAGHQGPPSAGMNRSPLPGRLGSLQLSERSRVW